MHSSLYYLNNSGSRWVLIPKPKVKIILPNSSIAYRTALCYESFGNYATVQLCYKGIKKFYLFEEDGIHVK